MSVTPSVEFASDRWAAYTTVASTTAYIQTGAYALLNGQVEYVFAKDASVSFTARNILDQDYALAYGFPEAGRSFRLDMRAKF